MNYNGAQDVFYSCNGYNAYQFEFPPNADAWRKQPENQCKTQQTIEASTAGCDGQRVRDVPWLQHFVIASLRRGTQVLIPKGDTTIQAGETLMVVGESNTILAARRLCQKDSLVIG